MVQVLRVKLILGGTRFKEFPIEALWSHLMALPGSFTPEPISHSMSDGTGDSRSLSRLCVSCPTEICGAGIGTLGEAFALSAVASLD